MNNTNILPFPPHSDAVELSKELSNFTEKVETIITNIDSALAALPPSFSISSDPEMSTRCGFCEFRDLANEGIKRLVCSAANTTCDLDR